jgi:hypothetical protein
MHAALTRSHGPVELFNELPVLGVKKCRRQSKTIGWGESARLEGGAGGIVTNDKKCRDDIRFREDHSLLVGPRSFGIFGCD